MEEETYVFTDQHDPEIHASKEDLTIQHENLKDQLWYHGAISRNEAERRITINGSFLVRASNSSVGDFVVTTKWNGHHHHILILRDYNSQGQLVFKFESKEHKFQTVVELIKFYKESQLPFTEHSEAALYKPCLVTDVSKKTKENVSHGDKFYRSVPSWFSPELRRQYKQRSNGMHRFASEHALSDQRAIQVHTDLTEEAENSPQSPLQNSGRFKSLFDLDRNKSDSAEFSLNDHVTSNYCRSGDLKPLKPEKPPILRRSAFMGTAKFHHSFGEKYNASSLTSLDSEGSDYTDYSQVKDFSNVEKIASPSPERKRKNPNINKGRYLEMVDKTTVPIRNPKIWNELSPTSPVAEHKALPCTQELLCNDPNFDPTYIDMTNQDRFLSQEDLHTPVQDPQNTNGSAFTLEDDDIYAVVAQSSLLTNHHSNNNDVVNKGQPNHRAVYVHCWQFMIHNCHFLDWNNVRSYIPQNWTIDRAMDRSALTRVRELFISSSKSNSSFSIATTVATHLTLEDARILLGLEWPALPVELSRKIDDNWMKQNVPGVNNGFQLCLLPDAVAYKNDIKHRYDILTRFVIATVVSEERVNLRISLFHTWLLIADCLLNTYRNYYSLQAVLNAIFSKQIQTMSYTIHLFTSSSPSNLKLYSDLRSIHNRGTASSTCLSTCVPDVGRLVELLQQSGSQLTDLSNNVHTSCVSSRDDLNHLMLDLDNTMSFLLSAVSWQNIHSDDIWLREVVTQQQSDPWWYSFLRTESQFALLFGPKTPDLPSLQSLSVKLDRALLLFAEQTELRIQQY